MLKCWCCLTSVLPSSYFILKYFIKCSRILLKLEGIRCLHSEHVPAHLSNPLNPLDYLLKVSVGKVCAQYTWLDMRNISRFPKHSASKSIATPSLLHRWYPSLPPPPPFPLPLIPSIYFVRYFGVLVVSFIFLRPIIRNTWKGGNPNPKLTVGNNWRKKCKQWNCWWKLFKKTV